MAGALAARDRPLSDAEWMAEFRRRSVAGRVPISGILELTTSCNLKCVHCYLGPQEEQRKKRSLEMSTERVREVIDEIAASGCLYLVITGGDPMVRKDFPEVYRHAREQGLIVTVFCDGILVTERIVELFREYPPFKVDISVYGATPETYEKVTRVPGSWAKFRAGLERLRAAGVPLGLKTVLMTVNRHELPAMRQLASELGVGFRVDSAIFPCLTGEGHEPLDYRVDPKEAVELELSDPEVLAGWVDYVERQTPAAPDEGLYRCGAGVTNFYLDPQGFASPCLLTTHYRYPLEDRGFASLWERELVQLRARKPRAGYGCNTCEKQAACTGCPAFHYLENGAEDVKSDYVCETTTHRWQAIEKARAAAAVQARPDPRPALLPVVPAEPAAGCGSGGCGCREDET